MAIGYYRPPRPRCRRLDVSLPLRIDRQPQELTADLDAAADDPGLQVGATEQRTGQTELAAVDLAPPTWTPAPSYRAPPSRPPSSRPLLLAVGVRPELPEQPAGQTERAAVDPEAADLEAAADDPGLQVLAALLATGTPCHGAHGGAWGRTLAVGVRPAVGVCPDRRWTWKPPPTWKPPEQRTGQTEHAVVDLEAADLDAARAARATPGPSTPRWTWTPPTWTPPPMTPAPFLWSIASRWESARAARRPDQARRGGSARRRPGRRPSSPRHARPKHAVVDLEAADLDAARAARATPGPSTPRWTWTLDAWTPPPMTPAASYGASPTWTRPEQHAGQTEHAAVDLDAAAERTFLREPCAVNIPTSAPTQPEQ